MHAGAVVAAETLARRWAGPGERHSWAPSSGAPPFLLPIMLPTTVHCAAALGLHAALASARPVERLALPRFERIKAAELWSTSDFEFAARYRASLEDGARALSTLDEASRVFVLDFASPFSAGLGLEPPRGDISWQHWNRNLNAEHFVPPDQLLQDVRVVMEPKWGINGEPLRALYGGYIADHFAPVRETEFWRVHLRRDTPARVQASAR